HITFANQRFCALLKQPLTELIGKTDFDLFPEHLARKYREDDCKVLQSGKPLEQIEEHRTPDGVTMYVEVIKTPIQDRDGIFMGIQGLFWDVTERFNSDLALSASEHRYRKLAEATLDGIIVADHEGKIALFNPAAEKLFGYEKDEIIGQPVALLMPP